MNWKVLIPVSLVMYSVGYLSGKWNFYAKAKMFEVALSKVDPDLAQVAKNWFTDPNDTRTIGEFSKDWLLEQELRDIIAEQ